MTDNDSTLNEVSARPTKNFFVDMFTRDIELQDAILDLLDNCVDGIQRTLKEREEEREEEEREDKPKKRRRKAPVNAAADPTKPYQGFWAKIEFDESFFRISDNCGGIPIDLARDRAFRLGSPDINKDANLATVGVYGIGMKRAIFKMGRSCTVTTKHKNEAYRVTVTPEWLDSDEDWDLPVEHLSPDGLIEGTIIEIRGLKPTISQKLSLKKNEAFLDDFLKTVSTHYSYIIHKGFGVSINTTDIIPESIHLQFMEAGDAKVGGRRIAPFIYEGRYNEVDVHLIVGLYRELPTEEEIEEDLHGRNTKENAGWTIICNDRVVVYSDKTKLTGWGEASVPKYHSQFIAIAGIVRFHSNDASKLPVTTTKRGIDAASDTYLTIKNIMREGLKIFTTHTNKWKSHGTERKALLLQTKAVNPFEVSKFIKAEEWREDNREGRGRKFVPKLPEPVSADPSQTIRFSRLHSEIRVVSEYLFGDPHMANAEVGGKCFDDVLVKARQTNRS